ncbi:hypothetical protein SASPL_156822 [Salvia splendens]|uniref:Reverse transcriptase domain-containing protein n=1 Tax=Salvia splendens TaxID=180675 RepID=A0A8X8VW64_SALSN|nr:hypothetical protein SASPL_156822 [Salvia splendens]
MVFGEWMSEPSLLQRIAISFYEGLYREDEYIDLFILTKTIFQWLILELLKSLVNHLIMLRSRKLYLLRNLGKHREWMGFKQVSINDIGMWWEKIYVLSVIYKLVTKAIANRLKQQMPLIIGPTQSSFVVEKAYDRVSWAFLFDTLNEAKLPAALLDVIMTCVSTSSMQVLWNGSLTEEFTPSRGLRQGCSLSPYLFVLCMERMKEKIASWSSNQISFAGRITLAQVVLNSMPLYAMRDIQYPFEHITSLSLHWVLIRIPIPLARLLEACLKLLDVNAEELGMGIGDREEGPILESSMVKC